MASTADLVKALERNVMAVKSLRVGFLEYASKLGGFFNPLQTMGEGFRRQESIQLKALAAGTTANKFLNSNTQALTGLQSSNLALREFMIGGFTQGLRGLSESTIALADEMIITGQNTDVLASQLGFVRFVTGNSVKTTSQLSQTILQTSRDNGVSSQKLIESLDSLRGIMTNVSIFGTEAVGSFAELGTALSGRLQGVQGSQEAITGVLRLLSDPLQIAGQELLGLTGLSQDLIAGRVSQDQALRQLAQASQDVMGRMSGDPILVATMQRAFGGPVVNQLRLVGQGIENFEGLAESEKKDRLANFKTMRNFEQKKMDFFNVLGPEIHSVITQTLPLLAVGQAGTQLIQTGRDLAISNRAGLGKFVKSIGRFTAVLGPLGVGISLFPEILKGIQGIFKNSEEPAELARQQLRASRTTDATTFGTLAKIAVNAVQQSGQVGDNAKMIVVMTRLTDVINRLESKIGVDPPEPQTKD